MPEIKLKDRNGNDVTFDPEIICVRDADDSLVQFTYGTGEIVDPYYQQFAEALIMRNAKYVSGDATKLDLRGFVTSDGNTLANLAEYSLAGFKDVEYMSVSDVLWALSYAFCGNSSLKILDVTAISSMSTVAFWGQSLSGCTALEAIIIRDGGAGLSSVSFLKNSIGGTDMGGVGGNDTFYVYVPSEYYDTIVSNITSTNAVPASRYRKLEDYPEIDNWREATE